MKQIITTPDAAKPDGVCSQATINGNLVFTAGQLPKTPDNEMFADKSFEIQTRQCLENIRNILQEQGLSMQEVLKTTVFMTDIEMFNLMNEAYAEYFQDNPPARSVVEVSSLPSDVNIEIEAIAARR